MILKLFNIICICSIITEITGHCRVELPREVTLKPKFFKTIGSHIAVVSNEGPWIDLQEDEIITARCDTNFAKPSPGVQPIITISCNRNIIRGYHSSSVLFECASVKWSLYESAKPFPWCPPSMTSYLIAKPLGDDYGYLAGVCYDFLQMSVVSLHYTLTSSSYLYPIRLRHYTPSIKIENISQSFVSQNVSSFMYDNPQIRHWIHFANLHNHSLVQNPRLLHDYYQQFGGLLEFVWWTGLRLGNWQRYEEALATHLETEYYITYDILSGISGYVSVPIMTKTDCQQNLTMVELVDRRNRKMPLYVWQYLKQLNLVVIGINSPFQEFYQENELVFCKDICNQIEWLKNVYTTFHYKAMGTVFCCSAADVQNSKRLSGFPISPKPVKSTTAATPVPVLLSNNLDQSLEDLEETESGEGNNDVSSY